MSPAIPLWRAVHKVLPVKNKDRVKNPDELQAMWLKSQFYWCAKYVCCGITNEKLADESAVALLDEQMYKTDALSALSRAHKDFVQLLNPRRGSSKNMKNVESHFRAQAAKFNDIATTIDLRECVTTAMPM